MNTPKPDQPLGLICPKCGGNMWEVISTTHKPKLKAIQRRRQCLGCGKRITTREVQIGP